MSETRVEKEVWKQFRKEAIQMYGRDAFSAVSGRHQLKKVFNSWWGTRDQPVWGEAAEEDAAADFLEISAPLFVESQPRVRDLATEQVPYPLKHGSLYSIAAYAEALPIVLRARLHVLGSKEAMTYDEAVKWLDRETSSRTKDVPVEFTYRFLVPNMVQLLQSWLAGASERGDQLQSLLDETARTSRIAPGAKKPRFSYIRRAITYSDSSGSRTVDLARCQSRKVESLVVWADRLSDRCVGRMATDVGGEPIGFEFAVWLILAGIWPRIGMYSILETSRDRQFSAGNLANRRQVPYMAMSIVALDLPPEEVASAYQGLRAQTRLCRRGRKMTAESEILCLAALEAKEIDGFGEEDSEFREAVLRRYSVKARRYGVDPAKFTSARGGWQKATKVLERVARAYRKLYPPSTIPVKTPDGPATLLVDEPDLFSGKDKQPERVVRLDNPAD